MSEDRKDFKFLCQIAAKQIDPYADLNMPALMYAIGGVESSFGENNVPRHEPSFDLGGKYADRELTKQFGAFAACSLGPWQVMYPNIAKVTNYKPWHIQEDPLIAGIVTALWMNRELKRLGPRTVADVLDMWNTGWHRDSIKPADWYLERGQAYYGEF